MLLSLRACLPATSRPQGKLQVFQHLSFSEQADGFSGPDQGIQTQDVGCIISSPDVQPSAQQTAPATPAAGTLIPPPPPRRPRRPLPTAPPAAVPALLRAGSLQVGGGLRGASAAMKPAAPPTAARTEPPPPATYPARRCAAPQRLPERIEPPPPTK